MKKRSWKSWIFLITIVVVVILTGYSFYRQSLPATEKQETLAEKIARLEADLREKNTPSPPGKVDEGKVQTPTAPAMPAQYGGVNGQGIHIKVPAVGKGYSAKFDPNGERELKKGDYLGNFTRIDLVHSHGQTPMYAWDIKIISPSKINVFIDGDHSTSYELGSVAIPNANNFLELQTENDEPGDVVVRWVRLDTLKQLR